MKYIKTWGRKLKENPGRKFKKPENMFLRMNESEMQFKIEKKTKVERFGRFL